MKFFELYPEKFFSVLSSANKSIYIEALLVIRQLYQSSPVILKEDLISSLIANLENQMLDLENEDGLLGFEDNLSGRAHFMVRKFLDTGWLEREQDAKSFEEQFVLPVYASKLLNLFYDMLMGKTTEYNGFVSSTYSILKVANEERDDYMYDNLKQAHQLTDNLQNALRELLANLRFYHQKLQERFEVKDILVEHFDNFRLKISDKIYHPLKTFDSVPRFKTRIIKIVKEWLITPELLEKMAQTAHKRGIDADIQICRQTVIVMLGQILETYEGIDQLLNSIDRKNSAYTRASVERMQYFLNTDRDIKGNLIQILKSLPSLTDKAKDTEILDALNKDIPLFQQSYVDENSLYMEPKRRRAHQPDKSSIASKLTEADLALEMEEFKQRMENMLSHRKVIDFILRQLEKQGSLRAKDIELVNDEDFIKLILASIKADEKDVPFTIEFKDDYLYVNGYRIPQMLIKRKGVDVS